MKKEYLFFGWTCFNFENIYFCLGQNFKKIVSAFLGVEKTLAGNGLLIGEGKKEKFLFLWIWKEIAICLKVSFYVSGEKL